MSGKALDQATTTRLRYRMLGTILAVDENQQFALVESSNGTRVACRLSLALTYDIARNINARVALVVTRDVAAPRGTIPVFDVEFVAPVPIPNLKFDPVHWLMSRHAKHR